MAKKYKHVSGIEVESVRDGGQTWYRTMKQELLPAWIVEQGKDWEEVQEPSIWSVNKHDFRLSEIKTAGGDTWNYLYFSTKENAEDYILNNKPCLSLSDVRKYVLRPYHGIPHLTELVKSKLSIP